MFAIMALENPTLWRIALTALAVVLSLAGGCYALSTGANADVPLAIPPRPQIVQAAYRLPAAYRGPARHGGIPLEDVKNARSRLASSPVRNTHGDPVGTVSGIVVGPAGRPKLVDVAFGGIFGIGADVVPLKADTLGYNPESGMILTDMTVKELEVIAARRNAQGD